MAVGSQGQWVRRQNVPLKVWMSSWGIGMSSYLNTLAVCTGFQDSVTSRLIFGQTYLLDIRCLVARIPGCDKEWRELNTTLHKGSGTKSLGIPVGVSQKRVEHNFNDVKRGFFLVGQQCLKFRVCPLSFCHALEVDNGWKVLCQCIDFNSRLHLWQSCKCFSRDVQL